MMTKTKTAMVLAAALALTTGVYAQHAQHAQKSDAAHDCARAPQPSNGNHDKHDRHGAQDHSGHLAAVNERGERAMGFSQTRTTHHFFLREDGGVIQVEANDAADTESRDRVRKHLAEIARLFAAGDFRTPLAVHDRAPDGAREMCRLRSAIRYEFEQTGRGGRVRIRTRDKDALAAVHAFLRFQIKDHQTGDKTVVTN